MNPMTRAIIPLAVLLALATAVRAVEEPPAMAAVWRHRPGNSQPHEITLHLNGRINDPAGQDCWTLTGRTLELRWPNSKAPGGFWVDTCTVSDDGETYSGVNQQDMPIVGWKVNHPAEATLSADDARAQMKQRPADPATVRYIREQIEVLAGTVRPAAPPPAAKTRAPIGGGANVARPAPAANAPQNASRPKPPIYAAPLRLRRQAAENLAAMGPAASDAVFKLGEVAHNDRDPLLRRKAMEALGELGVSAGIYAIGEALLQARDPELAKAAANALVNLLPAAAHRLTLIDAIFLLQVHDLGNRRVALAIESAWAVKGLNREGVANEVNKRLLAKQRDKDYFANEDAKRRARGLPTADEMLAGARERRANMFRGPAEPSSSGGSNASGGSRGPSDADIERERQRKWQEDRDRMRRTE